MIEPFSLFALSLAFATAPNIEAEDAQRRRSARKSWSKKRSSYRSGGTGARRASGSRSIYYANCSAARAAGAAPVYAGDPGYSRKLDRDGDGIGCE